VNRQQTVLSPSGRETSHIEQMTEIYAGKIAVIGAALGDVVSKNGLFEPFIYENAHFAKTGSGQTLPKLQKKTSFLRFLRSCGR